MTDEPTRLFLCRHGNTFDPGDVVTRVGARTDLSLSASGRAQAQALGAHFAGQGLRFDAAFCSPLARTRQTASAVLKATQSAAVLAVETFLTEIDYGPDENQPEDEVIARIGAEALAAWDMRAVAPPGWIVSPDDLKRDWAAFFAREAEAGPGRSILAVTSNGVARFALSALVDSAPPDVIKLKTGAYGVIALEAGGPRLLEWNERPK